MRYLIAALALASGLLSPCGARAMDLARQALVMLGPAGDLEAQIRTLTTTWPEQHVIAVVTTAEAPRCGKAKEGSAGTAGAVYCTQQVRPAELILARWFRSDPTAPDDRFAIHYWYDAAQGAVEIGPGERVLVFLAPPHAQGIYGCTVLRRATEIAVRELREALTKLNGR